jgi:hypothetical protein
LSWSRDVEIDIEFNPARDSSPDSSDQANAEVNGATPDLMEPKKSISDTTMHIQHSRMIRRQRPSKPPSYGNDSSLQQRNYSMLGMDEEKCTETAFAALRQVIDAKYSVAGIEWINHQFSNVSGRNDSVDVRHTFPFHDMYEPIRRIPAYILLAPPIHLQRRRQRPRRPSLQDTNIQVTDTSPSATSTTEGL